MAFPCHHFILILAFFMLIRYIYIVSMVNIVPVNFVFPIAIDISSECTVMCYYIPHIDRLYFRMFDVISSVFCCTLLISLTDIVCTLKLAIFGCFLQCNNFVLAYRHVSTSHIPVGFKGATS